MTARRVSPETRARRLKAEVERAHQAVKGAQEAHADTYRELDARKAELAARDPESVAIDTCVKALDALPGNRREAFYPPPTPTPGAARVLDYLHERFVGPRPGEAALTNELATAYERIRTLERQLEAVRYSLAS